MARGLDAIALLERAYDEHESIEAWFGSLHDATKGALDYDWGFGGYVLQPGVLAPLHFTQHDSSDPGGMRAMIERSIDFLSTAREDLVLEATSRPGLITMRAALEPVLEQVSKHWMPGLADSYGVMAPTGDGSTVVLGYGSTTVLPPVSPSNQRLWDRLAAHLGAAFRLLERPRGLDEGDVEAVLAPDGAPVDLRGDARTPEARDALREAVRGIDRARTREGRADPFAALSLWQGLFSGRWSLVEQIDSDGRRFVVARRNDPDAPVPGELTRRERQVLFYAATGWGDVEIGYALGLQVTTVSTHLRSGLDKLGLANRTELVRLAARLAREAMVAARASSGAADAGANTDGEREP